MKRLLTMMLLLLAITIKAQPDGMVLSVSNQPYTQLSSPTVVTTTDWDDFDAAIPLGFNYKLMGMGNDTVFVVEGISMGADIQFRTDTMTSMVGFGTDIMDRYMTTGVPSTVSYKSEQVGGKWISKIQWKDVGFFNELDQLSTMADSANFQIWLYQEGHVEIHFGSSSILTSDSIIFPFKKPLVYLTRNFDAQGSAFDMMYYVSSATPATVDSINASDLANVPSLGLDASWPAEGTVFRFSAPLVGVDGVQLNDHIAVYPTAIDAQCTVDIKTTGPKAMINVIAMDGKLAYQQKAIEGKNVLDLTRLAAGSYVLNVRDDKESVFYKVIKN